MGLALALASAGAKGTTLEQISAGLHLTADKQAIANKFSESMTDLQSKIGNSTLNIANKIYLKTGYSIKPEFKDIAVSKFHSDIELVDFLQKEQTAKQMNQWVEEKTDNKIKDLINPDVLDGDTRLVHINAIYFKGTWDKRFRSELTHKLKFWASETESKEIDFLHQKNTFTYGKFDDLGISALKMKYSGSDASLLVLLPEKRTGLSDLERNLHNINIKTVTGRMWEETVEVIFPKCKIESEIDMKNVLREVNLFVTF